MNVTPKNFGDLIPRMDIIIYSDNDHMYVETSEIEEIENEYVATGYYPMAVDSFETLIKSLKIKNATSYSKSKKGFRGLIPRNVLHYDPGITHPSIVWFVKGRERHIHIDKLAGTFHFPHLIFWIDRRKIKVYAVKSQDIDRNMMLYKAPFPNVFTGHNICWGTVRDKTFYNHDFDLYMTNVEAGFFNSQFTTEMMSFDRTKKPTVELLKSLVNSGKRFPISQLIEIDTLSNVVIR